jgi:hypothetical protein
MSVNTNVAEKAAILEAISKMVPAGSIAPEARKKVGDANPDGKSGKHTSKDKAVLGVPEENNICWAYPNFVHGDDNRFRAVAKLAGKTPAELGASIVMTWFADNREEIDLLVKDSLAGEQTAEEITKKMKAAEAQIARLKAMLESKTAA